MHVGGDQPDARERPRHRRLRVALHGGPGGRDYDESIRRLRGPLRRRRRRRAEFAYRHDQTLDDERCLTERGCRSRAWAPPDDSAYPAAYRGAFFADAASCIWMMPDQRHGSLDPAATTWFHERRALVEIEFGPGGEPGTSTCTAGRSAASATPPPTGCRRPRSPPPLPRRAPLTVTLDGGSSDPDADVLTYAWDTDGDGDLDDGTGSAITVTFDRRARARCACGSPLARPTTATATVRCGHRAAQTGHRGARRGPFAVGATVGFSAGPRSPASATCPRFFARPGASTCCTA